MIISEKFKQLARTGSLVSEVVLKSEDVAGVISSCSFSILVFCLGFLLAVAFLLAVLFFEYTCFFSKLRKAKIELVFRNRGDS